LGHNMVLGGNIAPLFLIRINLIRIKLIGDNHGGHVGGSNWMFLMEGDVVGEWRSRNNRARKCTLHESTRLLGNALKEPIEHIEPPERARRR